jgi:hypothetical protein
MLFSVEKKFYKNRSQVAVQDRVDARVGQAHDVADAVHEGVAVATVAHQRLENVGAEVLKK